jgi:branched-chain amino acid transport system substrate-binding protein
MKSRGLVLVISFILVIILIVPLAISCGSSTSSTSTAATSASSSTQTTQSVKTFQMGLMTSITGGFAPVCKPAYDAIPATEEILNKLGGITVGGQKYNIKISAQDDQSSPTGAVTAYSVLQQQGIKFMVNSMFPPANMAINDAAEKDKTIRIMAVGLGDIQLNAKTKFNFFASATVYNIRPAYDYFVKTYSQYKKIAVLLPDDPETPFVAKIVEKNITDHSLQMVFKELYPETGTVDYAPVVTKALATKPDAIELGFCIPPWAKGIITAAREQGFKGPIFGSLLLGDPNQLAAMVSPNYAYDIFSTGSADVNSSNMSQIVKDLKAAYVAKGGADFNQDSATLIEAAYPLLQIIQQAQSFDPDKVVSTFENAKSVETIYGSGTVGGIEYFGANHVVIRQATLSRIVNGKVEFEFIK